MNYNRIPVCALVLLTMLSGCDRHRHGRTVPDGGGTPPVATRFALQVSLGGIGAGTVSNSPSGVSCGTDCAEDYPSGTVVTLTASASSGSEFSGWSGACAGTDSCVVTMDAAKSVTAGFALVTHSLSVSKSGSGTGTVTTAPAGIHCGVDCEADYASAVEVTLTASADANSTFAGWNGGGCSGAGACVVTMSASTTVTAAFDAIPQIVTHRVGGIVTGLTGTVVLQNNGTDDLSIASDGGFTFSNSMDTGAAYNATVLTQPATQTCTISSGAGVIGSSDVTDVAVTCINHPSSTTLSISASTLALANNCQPASSCVTAQSSALTGNPRKIIVTNTGTSTAQNLSALSAGLPTGTSISSTCSGTLAAGDSCTITVAPGSMASSSCQTGIAPTPGSVTVSGSNSSQVTSNVVVLTYGCQYQGGFVYSLDDTTADTGSIGGKVVSLMDQAAPYIASGPQATSLIWSSNGAGASSADVSNDIVPLISETSGVSDSHATAQVSFDSWYANTSTFPFPAMSAFSACDGAVDGACNSGNIQAIYNSYQTNHGVGAPPYVLSPGPTPPTYYAAGSCTATINSYSDWYLPAICEVDALNVDVVCPAGTQSMLGSLSFLIGDDNAPSPETSCSPPSGTSCLAGFYWTSTQSSLNPRVTTWAEMFTAGGSSQTSVAKDTPLGVRCSRALTN